MKFLVSQLTYFFTQGELQRNIRAFVKYLLFLLLVIFFNAAMFQVVMHYLEEQQHSWASGFYFTLVTMTTLGFGDIVFHTDVGRLFSVWVLCSGVILLLVMLPFTFIRYFYAPWLEAQIRTRLPRSVPEQMTNHVVICEYDSIAPGLIGRLKAHEIPYFVLEPELNEAARLQSSGFSVVSGEVESRETYERLAVSKARLIFANREDTTNTNIVLTVREVDPNVPVIAVAHFEDSIDILELSGATHVLPLSQRLGEHLANRVEGGRERAHVIGRIEDLLIAEFPVHDTPLVGQTIRQTRLREVMGLTIVGVWEQGRMIPAYPYTLLSELSVAVIVGTREQIDALNRRLVVYTTNLNPVVIIGGGKVGRAVARALKRKDVKVHIVEKKRELQERIGAVPDRVVFGDAADREILVRAGILEAPSVVLTTNDDAMNIYLSVYCRRLNSSLRIISRITHERNLEAVHRAGADLVLSYASLGAESVFALLQGREAVLVGEGIEFFLIDLPASLEGKTLAESEIGNRTGVNVIAIKKNGRTITNPSAAAELAPGSQLLILGTPEQRKKFLQTFR